MKAFLFVGLIIFGMVATEGVVMEEHDDHEILLDEPVGETPVGNESLIWCQVDDGSDGAEGEDLSCLEDDEQLFVSGS